VAAPQELGANQMKAEVAVSEREPCGAAEPANHLEGVHRVVTYAPAAFLVEEPGKRVENRVQVRRDVEPERFQVVADIHDRRHRFRAGRPRERVHTAGAAQPSGQHGDTYAHVLLAIVPFKGVDGAKTRLAAVLSEEQRERLALEMLERVLAACEGASSIERTLLVTPESGLSTEVDVLVDAGTGHADAVALALADPRAQAGALVLMADCPLAEADAIDRLVDAARPLALVPARDGGINALALRDLELFSPTFGVPAGETIARARLAGLDPAVVDDERLSLDVDRPEDLAYA
jgi:2-phospho-L-lactate/phosphoenolpyruvate guanylyltransferase